MAIDLFSIINVVPTTAAYASSGTAASAPVVTATVLNTRSDSALPGYAVAGFMSAAQAVVDLINSQG